jgi:RHS repeat-associated protein
MHSVSLKFLVGILSFSDYYPFGMQMPGRNGGEDYRYAFNGMEGDDEIKGSGNSYDFGARMYDARIGRWLSIDPHFGSYPEVSPYAFVANNPIIYVDPDGKDIDITVKKGLKNGPILTIHDFGVTYIGGFRPVQKVVNGKTVYDLQIEINYDIHNLVAGSVSRVNAQNPGLYDNVEEHEKGHVEQFRKALQSESFTYAINDQSAVGGLDEVTTMFLNESDAMVTQELEDLKVKVQAGVYSDQETYDAEVDKIHTRAGKRWERFTSSVNRQIDVKMRANASVASGEFMDTDKAIENDANNRANEVLESQGKTTDYNTGTKKAQVDGKEISSHDHEH